VSNDAAGSYVAPASTSQIFNCIHQYSTPEQRLMTARSLSTSASFALISAWTSALNILVASNSLPHLTIASNASSAKPNNSSGIPSAAKSSNASIARW
jgi:hypothetical protein